MARQNQIFTRQYVLILINEILKNKNVDTEEESDADIDVRISLRNEFIRSGLTDKRILRIRSEAMDEKQELLVKEPFHNKQTSTYLKCYIHKLIEKLPGTFLKFFGAMQYSRRILDLYDSLVTIIIKKSCFRSIFFSLAHL